MRKIVAVAVFAAMTMLGTVAAGAGHPPRTQPQAERQRQQDQPCEAATEAAGQAEQTGQAEEARPGEQSSLSKGEEGGRPERVEVSRSQFDILLDQCRFADTHEARCACRAAVKEKYRVGAANPSLDCRTYSGVSVCGELTLNPRQKACVEESVQGGITYRRAEVECYAFR
ncbi:hypothetical protein GCM10009530_08820 [Microbispora corallina]|uniref:Uncharacterized protein n=1 Tax=Microbispora corallina TaxID=83302 RepID=A0ABQ4FVJ1_9ACTN|nr:hypothetical protein [Microbispora corallina]GIH38845.1 hypothetical protein Mco01_18450 [Microbispora corallina]